MKRNTIWTVSAFVVIVAVLLFLIVLHDASIMRRSEVTEAGISHIAGFIEVYRDRNGRYPSSLRELEAEVDNKGEVHRILNDKFQDKYEYEPSTNGFRIIVTTPSSLFQKWDAISKTYKLGEGLNARSVRSATN
jgi:hypothetical protein